MTQGIEQGVGATLVAVRNGPGARLRAAREAMGFSELEVAQQLRLSQSMIERLEQDNYDTQMPLVFVKGYLRSYAGLVGLDPEQVLIEFGHLGLHDPVRDVPDLGQSQQRKLSNFDSAAPKHRPGLLWGSLAIFAGVMLAFVWSYRDQIPALNAPAETTTTLSTTGAGQSPEEAELNAALEAARNANAQAVAASNATTPAGSAVPAANAATPTAASTPTTAAATPAPVTATPAPTANASDATPTVKSTTIPASAPSEDEDDEDSGDRPVKPVSVNAVKVPASKRSNADKPHETMLF